MPKVRTSREYKKLMFSDEEDTSLVVSIWNYPILHRFELRCKRNKEKIGAWKYISRCVGRPIEDCKRRWKSLRDHKRRYENENRTVDTKLMQKLSLMDVSNVIEFKEAVKKYKRKSNDSEIPINRNVNPIIKSEEEQYNSLDYIDLTKEMETDDDEKKLMNTATHLMSKFEQKDSNVDAIDKTQEIEEFEVYTKGNNARADMNNATMTENQHIKRYDFPYPITLNFVQPTIKYDKNHFPGQNEKRSDFKLFCPLPQSKLSVYSSITEFNKYFCIDNKIRKDVFLSSSNILS